jgi:hypothetical protein
LAGSEGLDLGAVAAGAHPAPMPILRTRRVQVETRAPRVGATFDPLHIGSGEKIEQVRGQAREQLRCGALAASSAVSLQSRRQLRL